MFSFKQIGFGFFWANFHWLKCSTETAWLMRGYPDPMKNRSTPCVGFTCSWPDIPSWRSSDTFRNCIHKTIYHSCHNLSSTEIWGDSMRTEASKIPSTKLTFCLQTRKISSTPEWNVMAYAYIVMLFSFWKTTSCEEPFQSMIIYNHTSTNQA